MSAICGTCGTPDTFPDDPKSETAPYGPGGGLICALCAFGTPEAEMETKARWMAVTDAEEAMGLVHIVGIPADATPESGEGRCPNGVWFFGRNR